jgi:hypothetical protein
LLAFGPFSGELADRRRGISFGQPVDDLPANHLSANHLSTVIRMGDAVINKGNSDERHCRTG